MNIGEKLFELRKAKNLSQEEVADKLNVTRQTVSKWETNQSTPDFDKIIPICELFKISTDELLRGSKEENKTEEVTDEKIEESENIHKEAKRKSAEVVSTSVFIYIASIAFLMVGVAALNLNPVVITALFLCAIAWATARIIKNYMSMPKLEKTGKEKKEENILKQINGIVGAICIVIYFIVSLTTMAWYITWVIFIIDGLICRIIKLLFMLNEKEEK